MEYNFVDVAAEEDTIAIEKLKHYIQQGVNDVETLNLALLLATMYNRYDTCKFLIEAGATELNEPLKQACYNGDLRFVSFFMEKGANDLEGALFSATRYKHMDIVVYLLEKGAVPFFGISYTDDVDISDILYATRKDIKL